MKIRMINAPTVTWAINFPPMLRMQFYAVANFHGVPVNELFKHVRQIVMRQLEEEDDEVPDGLYSFRGLPLDNQVDIAEALAEHHWDIKTYRRIIDANNPDDMICALERMRGWAVFLSCRHPLLTERGLWAFEAQELENALIDFAKRHHAMRDRLAATLVPNPNAMKGGH